MALETCFNRELQGIEKEKEAKSKPGVLPAPSTPSGKMMGRGQTLKFHLQKATPSPGWKHVQPNEKRPDIGKKYETPRQSEPSQPEQRGRRSDEDVAFLCEEQNQAAGWSPLTDELLTPGEDVTDVSDYNEDPEITATMANIPPHPNDVEMQEVDPPPGVKPEVSCTGYNHYLVRATGDTGLGPSSPVTIREDQMLDDDPQTKALGTG